MAMVSRLRRGGALAFAVLIGGAAWVGTVHAHAAYLRSMPGAGAVVATAPVAVEIWFTQDLFRRAGENWITVTGPDGAEAHTGAAVIDDDDRRHMTVGLAADLPLGVYTVAWGTLSAEDGDNEAGTFTFTLDPQAEATSSPMSAATATAGAPPTSTAAAPVPSSTTPGSASQPGCALGLAPGVVLAALVVLAPRRRRHP